MVLRFFLAGLVFLATSALALEDNKFHQFTKLLTAEIEQDPAYSKAVQEKSNSFKQFFVEPISKFSSENLNLTGDTLFYPFAGADISYPLLLFPNFDQYILIGLEVVGNPDIVNKKFDLSVFSPQAEGYLRSGFFKTMSMSAQIQYNQGVIPMLVMQIGLLGGIVENITLISESQKGLMLEFTHNNKRKKLYYFRANLDDSVDKNQLFDFIKRNKIDACMLKASSYKLQQIGFAQMLQFTLDNCPKILQDDTGVALTLLQKKNLNTKLFGNYIKPFGDEFRGYYQKSLAQCYEKQHDKTKLSFCYGYGCGKVEANMLLAEDASLQSVAAE